MGKRFNPRDLLGIQSLPQRREDQTIVYRDPRELIPTQENFYNTRNIEKLKASIKITGYLMQPILIENVNEKDRVLAGHRRRLCCIDLINEGDTRFEKVPCMYASEIKIPGMETLSLEDKEKIEPILRQFKVIQTNNYRDKSDWEKMQEFLEMEKIVKQFKESMGLKGNLRDELKELMGISGGQYSRYKKISNNLIEELMKEFKEERIKISVADAVASLKPELQQQAYEIFMENGTLTPSDVEILKEQQDAEKGIPGQMTIEQATRQQKPAEDETPIPVELQIERFFDSLKKNTTARIRNGDKLMGTKMISMLYCYVKHRNGYLNYQGHPDRITFNPGSLEEKEMTWQELTEELIRRYSTKKPVKMTTIDAPEPVITLTESAAVKAFCETYPKKLKTIMRICRQCKNNGEAAKAVQKEIAPYGLHAVSGSEVEYTFMGFTAGLEIKVKNEKVSMKYGRLIVEAKNLYDPFSPEFDMEPKKPEAKDEIPEKSCQSAAETPDEKQQEDHSGDLTEMGGHLRNTDKIPDAWPEELKDIPIPSTGDLSIYLQKQEDLLKRMTEVEKEEAEFPELVIKKQQMLVAGLRILKNLVEDCQEEPEESEQPPLPIMKNNDQRKEWLRNYKNWGLWYTDNHTGVKYYKYDFENGARLIVEEYEEEPLPENSWYVPKEPYYMHLIGGPEPDRKGEIPKWTYHSKYNKYPNSETELVEFLKEIQK